MLSQRFESSLGSHTMTQCTMPGGTRLDGDSLSHTHIKSTQKWVLGWHESKSSNCQPFSTISIIKWQNYAYVLKLHWQISSCDWGCAPVRHQTSHWGANVDPHTPPWRQPLIPLNASKFRRDQGTVLLGFSEGFFCRMNRPCWQRSKCCSPDKIRCIVVPHFTRCRGFGRNEPPNYEPTHPHHTCSRQNIHQRSNRNLNETNNKKAPELWD